MTDAKLVDSFAALRVPRHLFKFLFRLLAAHCQQYADHEPRWQISANTFDTQLALYRRDQQQVDRGLGAY